MGRQVKDLTVAVKHVFQIMCRWHSSLAHNDLLRINHIAALESSQRLEEQVTSFLTRVTDGIDILVRERCRRLTVEELAK